MMNFFIRSGFTLLPLSIAVANASPTTINVTNDFNWLGNVNTTIKDAEFNRTGQIYQFGQGTENVTLTSGTGLINYATPNPSIKELTAINVHVDTLTADVSHLGNVRGPLIGPTPKNTNTRDLTSINIDNTKSITLKGDSRVLSLARGTLVTMQLTAPSISLSTKNSTSASNVISTYGTKVSYGVVDSQNLEITGNIYNGLLDPSKVKNAYKNTFSGSYASRIVLNTDTTTALPKDNQVTQITGNIATLNSIVGANVAVKITITPWKTINVRPIFGFVLPEGMDAPATNVSLADFVESINNQQTSGHYRKNAIYVGFTGEKSFLRGNVHDYYYDYLTAPTNGIYSELTPANDEGTHLVFINNATWFVKEAENRLYNLTLDKGAKVIFDKDFDHTQGYQTLTIDSDLTVLDNNPESNAFITMNIDGLKNQGNSDQILIKGTHQGHHLLNLNFIGDVTSNVEGTVLIRVKDEKGHFSMRPKDNGVEAYSYELEKSANEGADKGTYATNWTLKKVLVTPSLLADDVSSLNRFDYDFLRSEDKTLRERLGHFRTGTKEFGTWVSVDGFTRKNGAYRDRLNGATVGVDFRTDTHKNFGIFLRYGQGDIQLITGNAKNRLIGLGAYYTAFDENQRYIDFVLQGGRLTKNMALHSNGNWSFEGKTHRWLSTAAVEVGQTFQNEQYFLEPRARVTFGWLDKVDFTTSNGTQVTEKSRFSAITRVGLQAGYHRDERLFLNGTFDVLHDFGKGYGITEYVNQNLIRENHLKTKRTWVELGVSTNWRIGKNTRLYGDVKRAFGSGYKNDWRWHLAIEQMF